MVESLKKGDTHLISNICFILIPASPSLLHEPTAHCVPISGSSITECLSLNVQSALWRVQWPLKNTRVGKYTLQQSERHVSMYWLALFRVWITCTIPALLRRKLRRACVRGQSLAPRSSFLSCLPVSLMSAKVAMMVENEGRFSRDYQILKQSSAEIAEEQGASRGAVLIARR